MQILDSSALVKQRVCLKCGKTFKSKGPGNRICRKCTNVNARLGRIPEAVLAMQRGVKRHNGEVIDTANPPDPTPTL